MTQIIDIAAPKAARPSKPSPANPYATPREERHRRPSDPVRYEITDESTQRFARDIATHLGGRYEERDMNRVGSVLVGKDRITFYAKWNERKLEARIDASDVPATDRNAIYTGLKPAEMAFDPDKRSLDKIAADIQRRLIEPSKEALAALRKGRRELDARRKSAEDLIPRLEAMGLSVSKSRDEQELSFNSPGRSLYGTVSSSGTVSMDRLYSISLDKFERIAAILFEE